MSGWTVVRTRARLADTTVAAVAVMLASLCLIPLFVDLQWVLPAAVMVVVIGFLGAGARALGLPLPLIPVVEALGLLLTLTSMNAASEAWARLVPTSQAWDVLRALVQQGMQDAQTYAAPVATSPGVVLLAVGGVGLVALSTDTLFVSVRSPLLAGLPLLALYLAPALILSDGSPWWAFPLPAAGWLLILASDQRDRVRDWSGLPSTVRIRGLSAGARRTGLAAIAIATVAAVVLPAGGVAPWRSGDGTGPGGGTSSDGAEVLLDPLVSLRRDLLQPTDTPVLTYRTQATTPSYLRVSVLEDFDGTTWRPREGLDTGRDGGVPLPGNVLNALVADSDSNRVTGGFSFNYQITVESLQNTYLPLPYPISAVEELPAADGAALGEDWSLDPATGVAFSEATPATGVSYQVAALDPQIESGQLQGASAASGEFWPQLNLPGGMSPTVAAAAREVTAEARTPYDKAVALQNWFTRDGGFTYSTSVRSGADADYIAEFLDARIGYCEQFAGAMAVMARTLGIPSRVAVGFTQGSQDVDGTWHVTVRDAHAWPELWFDGVGWARFEPTPGGGGTILAPAYAPDPATAFEPGADGRRFPLDPGGFEGIYVERNPTTDVPVRSAVLLVLGIALALALVPMVTRLVRRRRRLHRRRYADVVDGAWAEIADLATDLGQPWSGQRTPRQAGSRLARGMSEPAADALRRIREQVEQVRYAAPDARREGIDPDRERSEAVRADVRTVARELRSRVRWQTRVSAYCWPSSERRRQRSSMRSMKPEDLAGPGSAGFAGASASSAGRAEKAE